MPRASASSPNPATIVALIVVTLIVILGGLRLINRPQRTPPLPQESSQIETRAFYIAQTALDRSVKALAADPHWREGFSAIPFEDGTYDVKIYSTQSGHKNDPELPPNYVRIVASSEIEGVKKEVEAVWVNAMAAFSNVYSAGNQIELGDHRVDGRIILGQIHNNSWEGGSIHIDPGSTLYGNITSRGGIAVGDNAASKAAVVYGSVWGASLDVARSSEIRHFTNLSEWSEGVDLNGDGDTADMGLSREPMQVAVSRGMTAAGRALLDGDRDLRIGGGTVGVNVGGPGVGAIFDPRPDFAAYYELTAGTSSYPPAMRHVTTSIPGDGEGHYFASSGLFLRWLDQNLHGVYCWRCAGDGHIDPGNATECPSCAGSGRDQSVEVSGVFYIDDEVLDLSELGRNLVVHGTIVVAHGDPQTWPTKTASTPAGEETIDHFPKEGRFVLKGRNRMNFTQSYRSDARSGSYVWRKRTIYSGENAQTLVIPEPERATQMRDFPAILAASKIVIEPRGLGFASHPGDIGDERMTVLQGVLYAEDEVRLHGVGGWEGEPLVFDEDQGRIDDEELDEPVLNLDLNGDGDIFDRVTIADVSTVPVIPVADREYAVDINNDGMLGTIQLGTDYVQFFSDSSFVCPVLIYQEGVVLSQSIHSCDQALVVLDPLIAKAGIPFGFEIKYGASPYQGLVSWQERRSQ